MAVSRSGTGWTVASDTVDNDNAITFGEKTAGGDETATYVGIGTDASGAGNLLMRIALTASLLISDGVTPEFAAARVGRDRSVGMGQHVDCVAHRRG